MARAIFVVVVFCLTLAACTQRVVCPAYQSAFIYDKDALRKKFSYFKEDSTPRVFLTASKNKYLIGVPVSYKKKERSLQTVAMTQVIPVVPDSLKDEKDRKELDISSVERNVNDSTAVIRIDTLDSPANEKDSIYVISKEREVRILKYNNMKRTYFVDTVGFNTEQDNYMWYLRDVLLLPDARLAKMNSGKKDEKENAEGKGKKKKGGFFKKLFKKKEKKADQDTTQQKKAEVIDYGYDDFEGKVQDSTKVEVQEKPVETPKEKKKKQKSKKKNSETPPAKKEEEGDGF